MTNNGELEHALLRLVQNKLDEKYPSHLEIQLTSLVLFSDEKIEAACLNELRREAFVAASLPEIEHELCYIEKLEYSDQQRFSKVKERLRRILIICSDKFNPEQSSIFKRLQNLFSNVTPLSTSLFFDTYVRKFRNNDEVMYSIWTIIERMDSNLIRNSVIRALGLDAGRVPNLDKAAEDAVIKNFVISFQDTNHVFEMGFTEKMDPEDEIFLYNVVPTVFDFRITRQRNYGAYLDKFNMEQHVTQNLGKSSDQLDQMLEKDESIPFYAPIQLLPTQCDDPTNPHYYANDCKYSYVYQASMINYPYPRMLINTFNLLKVNESIEKTEKDFTRTAAKLAKQEQLWQQYYYAATHALVKMIYLNIDDSERIIDNIEEQINLMHSKRHKPIIDISATNFLYASYSQKVTGEKLQKLREHKFPRLPLRLMLAGDQLQAEPPFNQFIKETIDTYMSCISLVIYNSLPQKFNVEVKEQEAIYLEKSTHIDTGALTDTLYDFLSYHLRSTYLDFRFFMDMDEMEIIIACSLRNGIYKLMLCGFFNKTLEPNYDDFSKIDFAEDYSSIIRKYEMKRKNIRDYQPDFTVETSEISSKVLELIASALNDCIVVHFTEPELMEAAYKILKNSRYYTSFSTIQLLAEYIHVGRRQKQFNQPISCKNDQDYSHYYFKDEKQSISESMTSPPQENPLPGKCNICKFGVDFEFPNYKEHIRSEEHIENYRRELGTDIERLREHASSTRGQEIIHQLTAMCASVAKANGVNFDQCTDDFNILLRNIGISVVIDNNDDADDDFMTCTDEFKTWRRGVLEDRFSAFEQTLSEDAAPEFESSIIACAYMVYSQNNVRREIKETLRSLIEQYGGEADRTAVEFDPVPITLEQAEQQRFTGVSDTVPSQTLYKLFMQNKARSEEKERTVPTLASLGPLECLVMEEQMRHQLDLLLSPLQDQEFVVPLIDFLRKRFGQPQTQKKKDSAKAALVRARLDAKTSLDWYETRGEPFTTSYQPMNYDELVHPKLKLPPEIQEYCHSHTLTLPPLYQQGEDLGQRYTQRLEQLSYFYRSIDEKITTEAISVKKLLKSFQRYSEQLEVLASYNPVYREDTAFISEESRRCGLHDAGNAKSGAFDADLRGDLRFRDDADLDLYCEQCVVYAEPLLLADNAALLKSSSDMQAHRQSSMESADLRLYEREMGSRQRACRRLLGRFRLQHARLASMLAVFPQLAVPNECPQHSLFEYSALIAYSHARRLKVPEGQITAQPVRGFDFQGELPTFETVNTNIIYSITSLLLAETAPSAVAGAAEFVTSAGLANIGVGANSRDFGDREVITAAANARVTDWRSCREMYVSGKTCNRRVASSGAW